jgi:hypothetical protein
LSRGLLDLHWGAAYIKPLTDQIATVNRATKDSVFLHWKSKRHVLEAAPEM